MAVDDKLKKINSLQVQISKLIPNPQQWDHDFLEKVKIDFTYASNKLEGNKVTYGQTIQILKDFVTPKDTSISDFLDIVNHKKVLDTVFENYQAERITESNIKKLHKELMKNPAQWSDETYYDPGKYKIFDNHTYRVTGKIHYYTTAENVSKEMADLMQQTNDALTVINEKKSETHPLAIANNFHLKFLNQIHPFGDGNGRIARIFMNLILLQNGFPPIFLKEVDKKEYLNCFTEEEKAPGAMLNFIADRLIESQKEKKKYLIAQSKDI